VIIQATALMAAVIVTRDENLELSIAYMNQIVETDTLPGEGNGLIDQLNRGTIKLPVDVDAHSSSGEPSIVAVAGGLELVDVMGRYSGSPAFDNLQVKVTTDGAWGTAKVTVKKLNESTMIPKNETVGSAFLMSTDYQDIGNGLWIRFGGATDATATADDEWNIAVYRDDVQETNPIIGSIRATRQ
jgi:hypothetical protein